MKMRMIAALVLAYTMGGLAGRIHAQGDAPMPPVSFSVAPTNQHDTVARGYFVYPMTPGATATGTVLLQSSGTRTASIALAVLDAQTARNGGSAFADADLPPQAVGRWIALADTQIRLGPNQEQLVSFTVRVPPGTRPGQYLAGLSAAAVAAPVEQPGTTLYFPMLTGRHSAVRDARAHITVQTRSIIAIQVDVPGTWTPALSIPGVRFVATPTGLELGVELRNEGDTFLKPTGTLVIVDARDRQVFTQAINLGTFVTGTAITYPLVWPGAHQAGTYRVDVQLSYAPGKTARYAGILTLPRVPESRARVTEPVDSATPVPVDELPTSRPSWAMRVVQAFGQFIRNLWAP